MSRVSEDRWKRQVSESGKACREILAVSENIRYAGAINKYGRTLAGFIRPGANPLLDSEHIKNIFFLLSTIVNLSAENETYIGKLQRLVLQHEGVKIVLIPRERISYIITIDKAETEYWKVVDQVKASIVSHEQAIS